MGFIVDNPIFEIMVRKFSLIERTLFLIWMHAVFGRYEGNLNYILRLLAIILNNEKGTVVLSVS